MSSQWAVRNSVIYRFLKSESQRNITHHGETCHGNKANLIIAVGVVVSTAGIKCRINPSTGGITPAEDIVEIQSKDSLLQHLPRLEGIVQSSIRHGIAGQRTTGVLGVVQILPTDEVGVPHCLPSTIVKIQEAVENGRGRESQRGVVVMNRGRALVPIFHHLVEILDLIRAKGSMSLDGDPLHGI